MIWMSSKPTTATSLQASECAKPYEKWRFFLINMCDALLEPTLEGGASDQDGGGGGGAPSKEKDNLDDVECEVVAPAAESRQQVAVLHEYQ